MKLVAAIAASLALAGLLVSGSPSRRVYEPTQVASKPESTHTLDPAAWGSNHVGKPIPEYVQGDECLFCHRNDIGPTWQKNSHGITVRQREDAPELARLLKTQPALAGIDPQVEFFLGSRNHVRFLKKEGYGRFNLLSTRAVLGRDGTVLRWDALESPRWDTQRFADRCAGCHTTAVDPETRTFSAFGLECYTCHGPVDLKHTGDTSLVFLSKKHKRDSKVIISTCAQCHLRIGRSRSTGLPYPNNFVPGDNLFKDFEVDFAGADDRNLNPGDRHVLFNVREVVLYGRETPTCITCHQVHGGSSFKHRRAPRTSICAQCHSAEGPLKASDPYIVHSELCEY